MKKIIFILLLCIMPCYIHALSGSVSITCDDDSIKVNEEMECSIYANITDDAVSSIEGNITLSDGLELVKIEKDSSWQGDNDLKLQLYTDDNKSGQFSIAKLIVKNNKYIKDKKLSIGFENVILSDSNFDNYNFNVNNKELVSESNGNDDIVNPKTNVNDIIGYLVIMFILSMVGYYFIKKKNIMTS